MTDDTATKNTVSAMTGSKFKFGEVEQKLDEMYKDPANAIIPIPAMETLVMMIFKGTSREQVEVMLTTLRRAANAPSEPGPEK